MRILLAAAIGCLITACSNGGEVSGDAPKMQGAMAKRAAPTVQQRADFGTLADFVGKTLTGSPSAGSSEQFTDVQTWEWTLGGKAILIRHALADGSYGGHTYVYKDQASEMLKYVYVTNSGFHTVGDMSSTDTGWVAEEAVSGHDGITRVRSTSTLHEDGSTTMTSEYLKDGEWVDGHGFEYTETNDPLPALKTD